jgi:acyl transferase
MQDRTEMDQVTLDDGRKVAFWTNRAEPQCDAKVAVVVCSAFGRRMHQHSILASYLQANGVSVVRYDALNHVGMSSGDPLDYTLSDGLVSLRAALQAARDAFPEYRLGIVATSLNARVALQAMADEKDVSFLVAISGVVNVTFTIIEALGVDYFTWDADKLPETVEFEGQSIRSRGFYSDYHQANWGGLQSTLELLKTLERRVVWYHGERDSWIAAEHVAACTEAAPRSAFVPIVLKGCGHDIGRNPAMARQVLKEVVCRSLELGGTAGDVRESVREPEHAVLMRAALDERRQQRRC